MATLLAPSTALLRPQPIGVFPFPAGLLLLPPTDDAGALAALAALRTGALPEALPAAWAFFGRALTGDVDGARAMLAVEAGPVAAYNRFVLAGDGADLAAAAAGDDAVVADLADVAAFVQGARDEPPAADALDGELRAVALMARAAWHLEREEAEAAATALTGALALTREASPVLAAQLLAQLAQVYQQASDAGAAVLVTTWREAVRLAGDAPLPGLKAELRLGAAMALHEAAGANKGALLEAVKLYQSALAEGITLDGDPATYALIQNNLGLAYASMPMAEQADKLRLAVAVQSFREALKVYTRDAHPDAWASTMLNMANALQYLPSSHPEENLAQAVETYEQLLEVRTKALDPVGHARLLANQGNALAHLGIFAPALEKLTEAYKLLHWHGEGALAASILEQVERINARVADAGSAPDIGATED